MSMPPVDLSALLLAVERASPVEAVEAVAAQLGAALGATEVSFLIADYSGRQLIRLGRSGRPGTDERWPVTGTVYGRVLRSQEIEVEAGAGAVRLVAPVSSRGEALGVLEMRVPSRPDGVTAAAVSAATLALAYVVIANRRITDVFEWGHRSVPTDLSAEIQRRLLPGSYTCETDRFSLAGWLEPAPRIAGDTFDYCVDHDRLHVSITDAMGHSVAASQLATLAVSSLRNSRRREAGVAEMAEQANRALAEHAQSYEFVTGVLIEVDLAGGAASVVNAGHPGPYRVRDGQVEQVHFPPDVPLGVFADTSYHTHRLQLEPGDRLVLVTDGMFERDAAAVDLPAIIAEHAGLHPRDMVQELTYRVCQASGGAVCDDATVVCLDWFGGS